MSGLRDSAFLPAEQYLDFCEERWLRLPVDGERLEGLSRDALDRIAEDPSTGVLFPTLTGANRGAKFVGMRSLLRYLARCAAGQTAIDSVKFHGGSRN
jgi:hypothetical protein